MPEQFENSANLTVNNSLQDYDAKEVYLHPKSRWVLFKKRRRMFCFHHFKSVHAMPLPNVPVRGPFSNSTVFEICRQKYAVFV